MKRNELHCLSLDIVMQRRGVEYFKLFNSLILFTAYRVKHTMLKQEQSVRLISRDDCRISEDSVFVIMLSVTLLKSL